MSGLSHCTRCHRCLWSNHEYALLGSFGSHDFDVTQVLSWLSAGALRPPPFHEVSLADAIPTIETATVSGLSGGRLIVVP